MQVQASGSILPPGTLPKVALAPGDLVVKIVKVYPENGEGVPSDYDMVDVVMPDGAKHEFQIKTGDKVALADKVKNLLMGKYTVAGFSYKEIPDVVAGNEIHLLSVTHK